MEEIQLIYPNSILIITTNGELKRIFTPFIVVCIFPIEPFEVKDKLEVEKLFTSREKLFVYQIKGKFYAYYYFAIV